MTIEHLPRNDRCCTGRSAEACTDRCDVSCQMRPMPKRACPCPAMMHSCPFLILCLLRACLPPCAARSFRDAVAAPTVTQFTLANGLAVVVIPDRRTPVVTHMLWYRVGAADEPPGKSGIAHFLEHLMFKGTAKNPAGRFSQRLAAIGGQENAFTSNDYTGYFQRVAREHLAELMEFEADRMTGLVLTDDIIVSRAQRDPRGAQPAHRERAAARASPSRSRPRSTSTIPITGRPSAGATRWRRSTATDALAFYQRFYTPDNAVLVVAGDVTPEEVKALAEKTYGKIERHGPIGDAHAPAGAAADRGAARHLRGPARHPAELPAQLSGAVLHHREGRRGRRARRAGAHPRRRLEQPALSRAGHRAARRDQCRRLVPGHVARCDALRPLRDAGDRRRARQARGRDRRRDRDVPRQGTDAPKSSSAPRAG